MGQSDHSGSHSGPAESRRTASADQPGRAGSGYVVLVPVKPLDRGKSRLTGMPASRRAALAAAFALDTVTAAAATPGVAALMAVTDDAAFARRLADLGCWAVPDGVAGDLNASLRQAAVDARRRWPALVPVALCADLPALRPGDLRAALAAAPGAGPCFVADADGEGTTMYAAPYEAFAPRFGPGSRVRHLAEGATEIGGALGSLRRDVDDARDLDVARRLGLGPHTTAALGSP